MWEARGSRQGAVRLVIGAKGAPEQPLDANRVREGEAVDVVPS
jgi:hypothetical protein